MEEANGSGFVGALGILEEAEDHRMQWWLKMAQGTTKPYKRRWMVLERGQGEAKGTSYTSKQVFIRNMSKWELNPIINIMIIGDGIGKTIITGDKSKGRGFSTLKSATLG